MTESEQAQTIKHLIPSTPNKIVMGRRGAQIMANEESKRGPSARSAEAGSAAVTNVTLDYSTGESDKSLYSAMYGDVETFLRMQQSRFAAEAMNVAESFHISSRELTLATPNSSNASSQSKGSV